MSKWQRLVKKVVQKWTSIPTDTMTGEVKRQMLKEILEKKNARAN